MRVPLTSAVLVPCMFILKSLLLVGPSQPAFHCSKLTVEILDEGVRCVQN